MTADQSSPSVTADRALAEGDNLLSNPCDVVVVERDGASALGWCRHCDRDHVIDAAGFDAGKRPWRREPSALDAALAREQRLREVLTEIAALPHNNTRPGIEHCWACKASAALVDAVEPWCSWHDVAVVNGVCPKRTDVDCTEGWI